jgi:transcriptional regulator with XRE-family HTH domain
VPGLFSFSGTKLREAREARHVSREQLALEIGRTANAIVRYETGHGQPSIATLGALGAALGVDPRALLVEDDDLEAVAR